MSKNSSRASYLGRANRPSFNDSKVDQLRYYKRRRHHIFSGNNNIYKQRRAKLNLERDMKWNGPHDQEFFRCFEQYLDEAIKQFVQSQGNQAGEDGSKAREALAQATPVGSQRSPADLATSRELSPKSTGTDQRLATQIGQIADGVRPFDVGSSNGHECRSAAGRNSKQDSRGTRSSS